MGARDARELEAPAMTARFDIRTACLAAIATATVAFALALPCLACPLTAYADDDGSLPRGLSERLAQRLVERYEDNVVDPTQAADNSFIYDTTIASLIQDASSLYDGKTVQVVGEVIGDRIDSGEKNVSTATDATAVTATTQTEESEDFRNWCWIMLNSLDDDSMSVSVLMSPAMADQIDHYGRYGVTGTTLQVRGTYHQACQDHDGQSDIHVTSCGVVSHGIEHPDVLDYNEFLPGVLALVIGFALMLAYRIMRERMR